LTSQLTISEHELQQSVIETARTFGFLVAHFRPARTNKGWRTPVSADGQGFPDLVMVNKAHAQVIFAELKSDKGHVAYEQAVWLSHLKSIEYACTSQVQVFVWTPADWPDPIVGILAGWKVRGGTTETGTPR
jgi:hypothetical protein